MSKPILYVLQDGADFYCYDTPACESLGQTWSAPFRVTTSDMDSAIRAREAFMNQARFAGWQVEWPNPFGES